MNTSLAMIYDISDHDRANNIVKIFSLLFPFNTYFYLLSSYNLYIIIDMIDKIKNYIFTINNNCLFYKI